MMQSEASEILRHHVTLRRMRRSIRSVNLEEPHAGHTESDFEESCALVKGVPEWTLQMLEVWVCDDAGSTWTVDAVQIRGKMENVPIHQIAMRLTLREAAEKLGVAMTFKQARSLYREAMSIVTDNLVKRACGTLQHVVR